MCTLICKYFDNIGWVAVKNRDRGYVPVVTFRHLTKSENDHLVLWDEETMYSEGVNEFGIGILSTALKVKNDEKEGKKKVSESGKSQDGPKIRKALEGTTIEECLELAIKNEINGHTAIYTREKLFLLEADKVDGKHIYKFKEIPKTETIARTNHGVWLKDAGYQRDPRNVKNYLSRISSEARMLAAKYVVDKAIDPEEMLNGLIERFSLSEPQLNPLRMDDTKGHMFTTAQVMIIPKRRTLYYRPVKDKIDVNLSEVNSPYGLTWLEVLSSRPIWQEYIE